jgi:dTDP-glucose 4,6-dehydratase
MKILVTGGAGFIGSNFIRQILGAGKGYAVVNYDKLTYAGNLANLESVAKDPNYTFVRGDICNAVTLEAAMRGCHAVVHFAAESHVDRSIYEPSPVIQTNITGTFVLLEVSRKLSISRFVHISTDEVSVIFLAINSQTKRFAYTQAVLILLPKLRQTSLSFPTYGPSVFLQSSRSSTTTAPISSPRICAADDHPCTQDRPCPLGTANNRDWLHVLELSRHLTVLERKNRRDL